MSAERPELRTSAFRTFSQFVLLIEIAIAFQIPQEDPFALGMAVVFFAVVALITNWLSSKGGRARWSKENILLGFGLFSAVGIIGVILAAGLQAALPAAGDDGILHTHFRGDVCLAAAPLTLAWTR